MSQLIENKQYSLEEILEKLRYQALSMPHSPTSVRYLRALESLKSTIIGTYGSCLHTPSIERTAGLSQGETVGITESGPHIVATAAETEPLAPILQLWCTDWLVNQWLLRVPFSTASLYLDIISSLYGSAVRDGQLPPTDIFTNLKAELKTLGPEGWNKGIDDEIFARALRLTRNASLLISDDAIAADLVLWSLTHGLLPLTAIALLKREDLEEAPPALREIREAIIYRHCTNARRKYIFPLRQSERTPRQLSRHIAKIVNALFRRVRLPQSTDPSQTVEALWAYAALRSGLPASQIVTYLGHVPLGLPVLKLSVVSCQLSESGQTASNTARCAHTSYCGSAADTSYCGSAADTSYCGSAADTSYCGFAADTFKEVGKVFLDNPPRWYAMSLRPGVLFTQVCRRIQLLSSAHRAHTS
ncbi:MAG: hypothetical protein K2M16_02740, partial [Muribaculaceae bacterium]|nr:hypothetical protein [Muribaculaceae bacterium]